MDWLEVPSVFSSSSVKLISSHIGGFRLHVVLLSMIPRSHITWRLVAVLTILHIVQLPTVPIESWISTLRNGPFCLLLIKFSLTLSLILAYATLHLFLPCTIMDYKSLVTNTSFIPLARAIILIIAPIMTPIVSAILSRGIVILIIVDPKTTPSIW